MAPVLLCPECRTKHPLDAVNGRSAFPCRGCGRTLKVPAAAAVAVGAAASAPPVQSSPPAAPPAPAPAPTGSTRTVDPDATQVFTPPVPPEPLPDLPTPPPIVAAPPPWAPPAEPEPLPGSRNGHATRATAAAATATAAAADDWHKFIPPRWIRFAMWIVAVPLGFVIVFWLAKIIGVLSTNNITDVALANGWSRFWPIVRLLPFVALAIAGLVQGGAFGIAKLRARREAKAGHTDPGAPKRAAQSSGKAA